MNDAEVNAEWEALIAAAAAESPHTMAYLQALRDQEVAMLEGKANRNWNAIQRLTRGTSAMLAVLTIGMFALGGLSLKAQFDIQDSRHKTILENCEAQDRRHFEAKAGIEAVSKSSQPQAHPTPAQRIAQQKLVDEFVNALSPYPNCKVVLRKAGL